MRAVCGGELFDCEHGINAAQCIRNGHVVLLGVHQLGQHQRDNRRDDNIEQHVDQELLRDAALCQDSSGDQQKDEHAVDREHVEHHRQTQFFGVIRRPFGIAVDRIAEPLERKDALSEGLDNRNAADIFHRFIGHIAQRILIVRHLLLDGFARHQRETQKADDGRDQAEQRNPPVKFEQEKQHADNGSICLCLIGELVCHIGFGGAARVRDHAAERAAADLFDFAERQLRDVQCQAQPDICSHTERSDMRAEQRDDICADCEH